MKTLIEAIGATISALILGIYMVLVGTVFVVIPLGALAFGTWLIIKLFTL